MVINIDIKIADDDGNLLQRFEKQIDGTITTSDKIGLNKKLGESFEDFLSEYMSFSGRTLRENLSSLKKTIPIDSDQGHKKNTMEKPLTENNTVKEIVYPYLGEKNIAAYSDNEQAALVTMVNYAMKNVIDKYEANLYPISREQEYHRLEAELADATASNSN
jgi:hypothetical protein